MNSFTPPSLPPSLLVYFLSFLCHFFVLPLPSSSFLLPTLSPLFFLVEGEGFGLHIAEGYAQTRKGLEVGVFVKEIVPNSAADRNGQ